MLKSKDVYSIAEKDTH